MNEIMNLVTENPEGLLQAHGVYAELKQFLQNVFYFKSILISMAKLYNLERSIRISLEGFCEIKRKKKKRRKNNKKLCVLVAPSTQSERLA